MNPDDANASDLVSTLPPTDTRRVRTIRGFFVGGGIPLILGLLMLIRFRMSLPVLKPGEAHCGMGGLGSFCVILFGSPLGAILGAIIGSDRETEQSPINDQGD